MRYFGFAAAVTSLVFVASAAALDRPISAVKLVLKRTKSGSTLSFVTKDPSVPFPSTLSADNPYNGTPGGMVIDLFARVEGSGSLTVPPGGGKPGWSINTVGQYKYVNAYAPSGPTPVKAIALRQGKVLKITAKGAGLPLAVAQQGVAIRVTMGTLRACAIFMGATVSRDLPGNFLGKNALATALPDCADATLSSPPNQCGGTDTFSVIQDQIFTAHGCNVGTCHGAFPQANLDLRPGNSYPELVGVPADNPAANAAGKLLVSPGDAAASFLSQKLHGTIDTAGGEGSPMPLVGTPLSSTELALVDAWINAGAPQFGEVPNAPCLPPVTYQPAPPLDPPPGGYQLVLNGPVLQPGAEQEGCMWIPVPNATDFDVGKWEFSLNPGTHHFAIFDWSGTGTPQTNVWRVGDFGCFSGANFGNNITGAPQSPYYVDAYPPGVARRLTAGRYIGLNAHYFNHFTVPIQIKVWINIYPYSGVTPRLATTIVDLDDTFSIDVPPYTVQVHPPVGQPRARWTNTGTVPRNVIYLGGHMHYRGLRFTVWGSDGTKLYESFDWAHPNSRVFTPPLVVAPGDYLEYECLYDNGVSRPVRLDASGLPTDLKFGVSFEDAMCIITGDYYE